MCIHTMSYSHTPKRTHIHTYTHTQCLGIIGHDETFRTAGLGMIGIDEINPGPLTAPMVDVSLQDGNRIRDIAREVNGTIMVLIIYIIRWYCVWLHVAVCVCVYGRVCMLCSCVCCHVGVFVSFPCLCVCLCVPVCACVFQPIIITEQ